MKRFFSVLMILTVIALCAVGLCACQAAPIGDVVGTYELTTFTRRYPDKMPEVEEGQDPPEQTYTTHNYIKEYDMKMYLVVGKDGVGYTVYKDKDTPWSVRTVKVELSKDSEDSNKISAVSISGSVKNNSGAPTPDTYLYVDAGRATELKHHSYPYNGLLIHQDYTQDVNYKRVSSATDLSAASKKAGKKLVAPAYELGGLDGVLLCAYGLYGYYASDFAYYAIQIDGINLTAKVYSRAKTAEEGTEEEVSVTYKLDEEKGLLFTIGDLTMHAYYFEGSAPPTTLIYDGDEDHIGFTLSPSTMSPEEYIQAEEESYAYWKGEYEYSSPEGE